MARGARGSWAGAVAIADATIGIAHETDSVLGAGTNLGLDPVALHSIALLVMMQWASDNAEQDWKKAAANDKRTEAHQLYPARPHSDRYGDGRSQVGLLGEQRQQQQHAGQ